MAHSLYITFWRSLRTGFFPGVETKNQVCKKADFAWIFRETRVLTSMKVQKLEFVATSDKLILMALNILHLCMYFHQGTFSVAVF